jgi:hypothetical protein
VWITERGRFFIVHLLPDRYFGIEPEQWLVERAIKNEIGSDLIRLRMPSFDYLGDFSCNSFHQKFDYILAQGVFTHAPESQIRKCMLEAAMCMKSVSIFTASYMSGDQNYKGDEWIYPNTSSYTPSRMADMASDAGLSLIPIDWFHFRGAEWVLMCKPENENNVVNMTRRADELHLREKVHKLQASWWDQN